MSEAREMLDLAARLGVRGQGRVEPNPLVGCVIVRPGDGPARARIIGLGHHRLYGGPHAEAEALDDCRRRGHSPAGATVYVTLEPCNAPGRNPACVDGLIRAGVASVIYARPDPTAGKGGGAAKLAAAGVRCALCLESARATRLSDPFITRALTPRPYVILKWAQTIDGKVATRTGQSRWISGEKSRRDVHLLRGRVDAIVTGLGTLRADNPRLTARDVPVRRSARRVLIDPRLSAITGGGGIGALRALEGAERVPVSVVCVGHAGAAGELESLGARLRERGIDLLPLGPATPGALRVDLDEMLRVLRARYAVSTVLVEAGPSLVGSFLREGLADECRVYVGPLLLGDQAAPSPASVGEVASLSDAARWSLHDVRAMGPDVRLVYLRHPMR